MQYGKLTDNEIEKLEELIYSKYDSVYDGLMDIARNGSDILNNLKLPKKISIAVEEISSKIKLPSVEIRGILELTVNQSDGVEIIKKVLLDTMKNEKGSNVEITYLGAPKYRLQVSAQDFKSAEKVMKPILEQIQHDIEKKKGTFKFTREESKKTRES